MEQICCFECRGVVIDRPYEKICSDCGLVQQYVYYEKRLDAQARTFFPVLRSIRFSRFKALLLKQHISHFYLVLEFFRLFEQAWLGYSSEFKRLNFPNLRCVYCFIEKKLDPGFIPMRPPLKDLSRIDTQNLILEKLSVLGGIDFGWSIDELLKPRKCVKNRTETDDIDEPCIVTIWTLFDKKPQNTQKPLKTMNQTFEL